MTGMAISAASAIREGEQDGSSSEFNADVFGDGLHGFDNWDKTTADFGDGSEWATSATAHTTNVVKKKNTERDLAHWGNSSDATGFTEYGFEVVAPKKPESSSKRPSSSSKTAGGLSSHFQKDNLGEDSFATETTVSTGRSSVVSKNSRGASTVATSTSATSSGSGGNVSVSASVATSPSTSTSTAGASAAGASTTNESVKRASRRSSRRSGDPSTTSDGTGTGLATGDRTKSRSRSRSKSRTRKPGRKKDIAVIVSAAEAAVAAMELSSSSTTAVPPPALARSKSTDSGLPTATHKRSHNKDASVADGGAEADAASKGRTPVARSKSSDGMNIPTGSNHDVIKSRSVVRVGGGGGDRRGMMHTLRSQSMKWSQKPGDTSGSSGVLPPPAPAPPGSSGLDNEHRKSPAEVSSPRSGVQRTKSSDGAAVSVTGAKRGPSGRPVRRKSTTQGPPPRSQSSENLMAGTIMASRSSNEGQEKELEKEVDSPKLSKQLGVLGAMQQEKEKQKQKQQQRPRSKSSLSCVDGGFDQASRNKIVRNKSMDDGVVLPTQPRPRRRTSSNAIHVATGQPPIPPSSSSSSSLGASLGLKSNNSPKEKDVVRLEWDEEEGDDDINDDVEEFIVKLKPASGDLSPPALARAKSGPSAAAPPAALPAALPAVPTLSRGPRPGSLTRANSMILSRGAGRASLMSMATTNSGNENPTVGLVVPPSVASMRKPSAALTSAAGGGGGGGGPPRRMLVKSISMRIVPQ